MKHAIAIVIGLMLALGCGAPEDDMHIDTAFDGAELGSVEQEYVAEISGPSGFNIHGVTESASGGCSTNWCDWYTCVRTLTGSTCIVPSSRSVTFCVKSTGWGSAAERDRAHSNLTFAVTAIQNELNLWGAPPSGQGNWSLSVVPLATACNTGTQTIIQKAVVGNNVPTSNSMAQYVQINLGGLNTLSEPVSLAPTFKRHGPGTSILLDYDQILVRGSTTTQENRLMRHALGRAVNGTIGIGSSGASDWFVNWQSVEFSEPIAALQAMSPGQACRAQRFNTLNTTEYRIATNSPACQDF